MAYVYVPNGVISETWEPLGEAGKNFQLNATMEPLVDLRDRFQIVTELEMLTADPGKDGGGDHARAAGSYLTGSRARKSPTDLYVGVSIDQVVSQQVGLLTPFCSLELTCDKIPTTGNCDAGYSSAYMYNLSWQTPTSPLTPEPDPRQLFERMFGSGSTDERLDNLRRRSERQKSILDFVLADAKAVEHQLDTRDRAKLDEYLTSLRDIERRIDRTASKQLAGNAQERDTPPGILEDPEDYGAYIQLMFDMLTLAFQTDQTRVAAFMLAYEGSNRTLPFLGVPEGHHNLSHHNNKAETIEKLKVIDRWYVQQFAAFLRKLVQIQDLNGQSILHNSMIYYGSGHSDANRHLHTDLPLIVAGAGGGSLTTGQFLRPKPQPISNLYLTCISAWPIAWAASVSCRMEIPRAGWRICSRPRDARRAERPGTLLQSRSY